MRFIEGSFLKTTKYIKRIIKSPCFYFTLSYVDEDSLYFSEINRFIEQSCDEFVPFQNNYIGYSIIDLTEWADKPINSKLEAFFFFLLDRKINNSKNKVHFFSEREMNDAIKKKIEEMFGEVEYINLGVKKETASQNIGFIVNNQKSEENENVRS